MASVNYMVLGKRNPSNIYCRFLHTRGIDIKIKINVFVNPKNWDSKYQKIKNVSAVKNRNEINRKLSQLKIEIIDNFNISFLEGEVIDKEWLQNIFNDFFKRPEDVKSKVNLNHTIYYIEFGRWWLEHKSTKWLTPTNTSMSKREVSKYQSFLCLIDKFSRKSKIKLSKSGNEFITNFILWLKENGYAEKTIKRHVGRVKFFFSRAKEEGFKIDPTYEKRVIIPKSEEVLEPILDSSEIETIFNLEISNKSLDNARDNLIIACWTGLRISDFNNNLNISNFIDDVIEITTTKTKTSVVIPIHPMVKKIITKHNGKLPEKVSDVTFNKQIKVVCEKAGLNNIMKGRIYDKESKRKVIGQHHKYKLITSHIGRRSFATNHFGKIPNSVIMGICGWSREEMMLKYIKKSKREHATQLKEYWEKTYQNVELS